MALSDAGTKIRQPEPRVPDVPQFVAHWLRPLAEQRAAESNHAHRHDQCGHYLNPHPGGLGGLLEHSPAAILTAIYVIVGLAVCALYNLNFVYIFLVISNLILAFVRLLIFWQLRRNPWIMWFIATNIGKAVAFFLAFMIIFKPELAIEIRPWLRLVWLTVFVFISIGAGDKAAELAHFLRMKREIYRHE